MKESGKSADNVVSIDPLRESFANDLKRSGLTIADARRAGVRLADSDETWKILNPKRPERANDFTVRGMVFPYFDPSGGRLPFSRVRRLVGKWRRDDDGSQRYASPRNSLPHLYLPAPVCDWLPRKFREKIRVNQLIITEGEKKAIKANLLGLPTVALGGVYAYQAARHQVTLLEEFSWFDLRETDVEVVFDSDAYLNPDVNRALLGLSHRLRRDANPRSLGQRRLTSENASANVGLDEFLAAYSKPEDARRAYDSLAKKDDLAAEAFAIFNKEIVHVRKKARYYNVATDTWYESQRKVIDEYARGTPVIVDKRPVYPINLWFTERPPETVVLDVAYTPGKPARYLDEGAPNETLNRWRPTTLEPTPFKRPEDVAPFIEFVDYLTPGLTEDERARLLDWMAWPLQNRGGEKVKWAVLIWSQSTGTGKNTLGRILEKCYGEANTYNLDGASLVSTFNDWVLHEFVIINEVDQPSYNERAAVMSRLKTLIDGTRIDLNRKYLNRENVPNHTTVYLTSNKHDALILDKDDRRFFVIEGPEVKWSAAKFKRFNVWLEGGGFESVYGYLLRRDLRAFNPSAEPPKTAAWYAMRDGRTNPVEDLVTIMVTTPAKILGVTDDATMAYQKPRRQLYLPEQLVEHLNRYAYANSMRANVTVGSMRAALSGRIEKRVMEINRGRTRRMVTAYALFEVDKWAKASKADWRTYLLAQNPELGHK